MGVARLSRVRKSNNKIKISFWKFHFFIIAKLSEGLWLSKVSVERQRKKLLFRFTLLRSHPKRKFFLLTFANFSLIGDHVLLGFSLLSLMSGIKIELLKLIWIYLKKEKKNIYNMLGDPHILVNQFWEYLPVPKIVLKKFTIEAQK